MPKEMIMIENPPSVGYNDKGEVGAWNRDVAESKIEEKWQRKTYLYYSTMVKIQALYYQILTYGVYLGHQIMQFFISPPLDWAM